MDSYVSFVFVDSLAQAATGFPYVLLIADGAGDTVYHADAVAVHVSHNFVVVSCLSGGDGVGFYHIVTCIAG